jgi:hypothetical protein
MKMKTRIIGMDRKKGDMPFHNCGSLYFVTSNNEVGSIFFSGSVHTSWNEVSCLASLGVCWRDRKDEVQSLDVRKNSKSGECVAEFETKDGTVKMTVKASGKILFKMPKEFTFSFNEAYDKRA